MLSPETSPLPPALPEKRVWGFWPTLGFSAIILFTYVAAQNVAALVLFALRFPGSGLSYDEAVKSLQYDGVINSVAILFAAALGIPLIYAFSKLRGGITAAEYLGLKKIRWKTVFLMVLIFIFMLALTILLETITGEGEDSEFMVELYRSSFLPLLVLVVVFLGPFFEELFFRGFFFVGLRASRLGAAGAVIITSLIWAAIHLQYSFAGMAQILVMGLVLGTVRHKTGSLWSSTIIHVLWNGAALVATALYVNSGGG